MAEWDPAASLSEVDIRLGKSVAHKRFELFVADSGRIGLKPKTGTATYLAAIIQTPNARQIFLSSASTDGMEVRLNGKTVFSNSTHKRWVRRDVNLTPLALKAGSNLVVIRLCKEDRGRWSTYLRFMNEDFQRADIAFSLPGAKSELTRVLQTAARLQFSRRIDVGKKELSVDCWLMFNGAKPLLAEIDGWRWTANVGNAPEQQHPVHFRHPRKSQYLLQRFTGQKDGLETLPQKATLQFNGATFTDTLRIRPNQLRQIFDALNRFSKIKRDAFPVSTIDSIEWRIDHLISLMKKGDADYKYISGELSDTIKMIAALEKGLDPYADKRNQLQRRGYRSKVDGALHHYALYVPPGWKEESDRQYSMIVALHGLGGHPVKTLSILFGNPMGEEETRDERIRFPGRVGRAPMFVLAPEGFGSSGYYALGERDVLDVIETVKERYRIDDKRIYITGASMGGTGAARIPLHYPDLFAASVPLCGYHNMRYYSQVRKQPTSTVEDYLLNVHSNIHWVQNGTHIPMHIVHGTLDQPRSSQDLHEHYKLAGNRATLTLLEDTGHNVWDDTYEKGWIFRHFMRQHRNPHPRHIRFKTANLRYNKSGWLRIDDMENPNDWAEITGEWTEDAAISITTNNIHAFTMTIDTVLAEGGIAALSINGNPVKDFHPEEKAVTFVKKSSGWKQQSFSPPPMTKKAGLAGPIGDIEYDSLLFVYGTGDPWEGTLAKRIIGHLNPPRYGMTVQWKVKADVEVSAADLQAHSIVIVGTPNGNKLLQRIQGLLPIQVKNGAIVAGKKKFGGKHTAASFIYPNPLNPNRYVLVHTGTTREAIYYTGHLPNMIPDYVIYDASDWGYTEGVVLGSDRSVKAAGFFDKYWQLK